MMSDFSRKGSDVARQRRDYDHKETPHVSSHYDPSDIFAGFATRERTSGPMKVKKKPPGRYAERLSLRLPAQSICSGSTASVIFLSIPCKFL
jgi:hypothetical protein